METWAATSCFYVAGPKYCKPVFRPLRLTKEPAKAGPKSRTWQHPLSRGEERSISPLFKRMMKKGQTARSSSLPFPISIILQNLPLHNKKRFDFGAENLYTYIWKAAADRKRPPRRKCGRLFLFSAKFWNKTRQKNTYYVCTPPAPRFRCSGWYSPPATGKPYPKNAEELSQS